MANAALLFVYGTLRRGGSNDIAGFVPGTRRVAMAKVRGTLYALGTYPALVLDPVAGFVRGEIYAIPADGWERLDALEEVVTPDRPDGEYFRLVAPARCDDGTLLDCQIYVANPARLDLSRIIAGGDWIAHTAGLAPAPTSRGRPPA